MSATDAAADRHVIIHYHIFKNAGTSVDRALRTHFGSAWTTLEAGDTRRDPSGHLSPEQIYRFLDENRPLQAISSHTADLPPPSVEGLHVHPIIMLRHPLDRIRSIYDFARAQKEDTPNSRLARSMSRTEFIARGLDLTPGQGRRIYSSYQATVLARGATEGIESERVQATLDSLPFVGVVEEYDRSMLLLVEQLRPFFPDIALGSHRLNSSQHDDRLEVRLDELRQELGEALHERLAEANKVDIALWASARSAIQAAAVPLS